MAEMIKKSFDSDETWVVIDWQDFDDYAKRS